MATLSLITYSKGGAKNPVLETFQSSFSRVWLRSWNGLELLCGDPAPLSLPTEPKCQSFGPCQSHQLSWVANGSWLDGDKAAEMLKDHLRDHQGDFISAAVLGSCCTHSLWLEAPGWSLDVDFFPPRSHLGVFNGEWPHHWQMMAMPWCFPHGSPKSSSSFGVPHCPSSRLEPDGWAREVESSLGPKTERSFVRWWRTENVYGGLDPSATTARIWGTKKYKSQFWEHLGPRCFAPAEASPWILNETCWCWCRNPPSCGLGLQNDKHKPLKTLKI